MNIHTLAIDIAKNVFQLHGNDESGNCILRKRLNRLKMLEFLSNLDACSIVMEACSGSNFLHQKFTEMGHSVKLIPPQHVKPFVKSSKNDANDAEAIAEASSRPSMRYVSPKSIEQQDIQCIHRVRNRLMENRVGLMNQIRGLLLEYGVVIRVGVSSLKKNLSSTFKSILHKG